MPKEATVGDRLRVFFIGMILSLWLLVIDAFNYSFNFDEDADTLTWARSLVLISGYLFAVPTILGSFMLLLWCSPKTGAVFIIFSCISAGTLRLVSTLIGFRDFWQNSNLDSTTAGTSDIAIAALQLYLIFDAHYLYRQVGKADVRYREDDVEYTRNLL